MLCAVESCTGIQCVLAGVSLCSKSEEWLQRNVYGRSVTFVPLSVEGDALHSIIYTRVSTCTHALMYM